VLTLYDLNVYRATAGGALAHGPGWRIPKAAHRILNIKLITNHYQELPI